MASKDFRSLQKQREMENKVEDFISNMKGGFRKALKAETKKEKLIKGSLAVAFMAVSLSYAVEEITEHEMVPMTVVKKLKIEDISCNTITERYKVEKHLEKGKYFRSKPVKEDSIAIVNDFIEKDRDCSVDTRYALIMNDGKEYELESNFLQGFSGSDVAEAWESVKAGSKGYFTTSKTITGKNIITDYRRYNPNASPRDFLGP